MNHKIHLVNGLASTQKLSSRLHIARFEMKITALLILKGIVYSILNKFLRKHFCCLHHVHFTVIIIENAGTSSIIQQLGHFGATKELINSKEYNYFITCYFLSQFLSSMDWFKNKVNGYVQEAGKYFTKPPENDVFQETGELSPDQFKRAGNKLTKVCAGWAWKPSLNPKFSSTYLEKDQQYLTLEKVISRRRLNSILHEPPKSQEKKIGSEEEDIIILSAPEVKEQEEKQQNYRYYTMYIIYDEYYHTPRMFFSATDIEGKAIDNQMIKEDIQKEYLDKTLTIEEFPFIEGLRMPTVHPCRHAAVLKTMSESMKEGNHKVQSHFALLIFLKFITSVIPTVEFDMTGDLIFQ